MSKAPEKPFHPSTFPPFTGKRIMSKTYLVDIASVYGVDEKTADEIKERPNDLNQKWLIDQVKKGMVYVCDVIEEDGFEHTGEENETE